MPIPLVPDVDKGRVYRNFLLGCAALVQSRRIGWISRSMAALEMMIDRFCDRCHLALTETGIVQIARIVAIGQKAHLKQHSRHLRIQKNIEIGLTRIIIQDRVRG